MFDCYKLRVGKHIFRKRLSKVEAVGVGEVVHNHRYLYAVSNSVVMLLDCLITETVIEWRNRRYSVETYALGILSHLNRLVGGYRAYVRDESYSALVDVGNDFEKLFTLLYSEQQTLASRACYVKAVHSLGNVEFHKFCYRIGVDFAVFVERRQ